jgi:hypothetical protein
MLDPFSRDLLNRRPSIRYISPPSEDVILEPQPEEEPEVPERVATVVSSFDAIEAAAEAVETAIADRAQNVTLELDLTNPEDFVAAQAAARVFPDLAEEVTEGVSVVKAITFDMYHQCIKAVKEHGKEKGKSNQIPAVTPDITKTDFGGLGLDRRPELNPMSIPFAPIDLLAYITTTVPLLFGMLFPLIQLYVKASVIGHSHNQSVPPGPPTGPGIPVIP